MAICCSDEACGDVVAKERNFRGPSLTEFRLPALGSLHALLKYAICSRPC